MSGGDIGLAVGSTGSDIGLSVALASGPTRAPLPIPPVYDGYPPNLPTMSVPGTAIVLVDESPLTNRSVVIGASLGDGYKKRYHLTNPGDATAFNALCRDKRIYWNGLHIESADDLLKKIVGNY